MQTITEQAGEELANRIEAAKRFAALMPNFMKLEMLLKRAPAGFKPRPMFIGEQVLLCVKVDSVRDIAPFLEFLEVGLDIDFDASKDVAESGYRYFTCANAPWIRVDAELKADGPGCRRVVVGTRQVPIYEIQCLETIDAPGALPAPGNASLPAPALAIAGDEEDAQF